MAPRPKTIATESQLKSFDWLPIEQWNVESIFNYYGVNAKRLCKICDTWVSVGVTGKHVTDHKKAREALRQKEKAEAQARAVEARKLKAEAKRREKERENLHRSE